MGGEWDVGRDLGLRGWVGGNVNLVFYCWFLGVEVLGVVVEARIECYEKLHSNTLCMHKIR